MKIFRVFSLILTVMFCAGMGNARAQKKTNAYIDSLMREVAGTKEDTGKVKLQCEISRSFSVVDPNEGVASGQRALDLASRLHWDKGMAMSYNTLGVNFECKGNFARALEYDSLALRIDEASGDRQRIATDLSNMGVVYQYQSNYPKALEYDFRSLEIYRETGVKKGVLRATGNIGNVYALSGDYPKSLEYGFMALKQMEEMGNRPMMASAYGNIGIVYKMQNNLPKALEYDLKSLKLAEEIGNREVVETANLNTGNVYMAQNEPGKALACFMNALKLSEELGRKDDYAGANQNIGEVYIMQKDYARALEYLYRSMTVFEQIGDKSSLAQNCADIGKVYVALAGEGTALGPVPGAGAVAATRKGRLQAASQFLQKGLSLGREIGSPEVCETCYESLAQAHSLSGDYQQALGEYKNFVSLRDSVYSSANKIKIAHLETQREIDLKNKQIEIDNRRIEIAKLQILNKRNERGFYLTGIALLAVVTTAVVRGQMRRIRKVRTNIASDLHDDIGSTLNSISIYSEVAKQDPGKANEALDMIGESSRKVIDSMSDIIWTINPENDSFEQIIERMRSNSYNLLHARNIELTFRADEALNGETMSIEKRRNFYLIFKEAINNILKYAGATRVSLSLTREDHLIRLVVRDNGKGFDPGNHPGGNGLKNMQKRARDMNATLTIESSPGEGTEIELRFKV